jgi:hypothetical protein
MNKLSIPQKEQSRNKRIPRKAPPVRGVIIRRDTNPPMIGRRISRSEHRPGLFVVRIAWQWVPYRVAKMPSSPPSVPAVSVSQVRT